MDIRIDVYYFEEVGHSLKWNNTVRIKVLNKTKDSVITINEMSCEMKGKKAKAEGVIDTVKLTTSPVYTEHLVVFPLAVHGNTPVEFYIPVTFEYSKSIGVAHQVTVEIRDVVVNSKRINIQPLVFNYSKAR